MLQRWHQHCYNTRTAQWVAGFLSRRPFRIINGDRQSDRFWLEKGVPQGLWISPLLFSVYINTLLEKLNSVAGIRAQAHDVMVLATSPSTIRSCAMLGEALKEWELWGQNNQMKFAHQKTELVHFGKPEGAIEVCLYNLEHQF